jgi:D-alanine-D-alanine ligase
VIPARIAESLSDQARTMALAACRAVGARGLARVDFFYSETSGEIWLNEINTLPGFTSQSMYPMLWQASGLTLEELVHQLVAEAQDSCRGFEDQGEPT